MPESSAKAFDPIDLSVTWNALRSITEEMSSALRRTAFSEAVREGDDFSTGLCDRQGRLIAQGNCSPGHLGSMPYIVPAIRDYIDFDSFEPGDAVLLNDSQLGSGHLPDLSLVTPIFDDAARRIGFAINIAHHVDVGGAVPGSQGVQGVTEVYQEGIRILPVRIVRNDIFQEDLLRVILGNVRLPEKVLGDLKAQRNANHIASQRFRRLLTELGADIVDRAIEEILATSERIVRESLVAIPNGIYSFEDRLDDFGPGTDAIDVAVDVTVSDEGVAVDFSRSSDQVAAGINSYLNYTRAYASFAVFSMAGIQVPRNDGANRPITVTSRPGSFFNPRFPAASAGRAAVQIRIFEAVAGALAKAVPHRAMAAFSHWSNPNIGSQDGASGKGTVVYDVVLGGYGARAGHDGVEGLCPVFNCANIPVEIHEQTRAVRVRSLSFVADSGGAGQFRGGCAVRKEIEILAEDARVSLLSDRHKVEPYGLAGGRPGALGQTSLNGTPLGSKGFVAATKGDVLTFMTCGAGGYGDPQRRDQSAVREDILDGFVTEDGASRDYGWQG